MYRIVKTELLKLKRYHILWAGVLLMLFTVFLTLFTSTAEDGSVWTFSNLAEQVIKNNALTIFPMCITLIAGYTIAREEKDDTLKIILPIPISYRRLLCGKLIVCGLISVFFGVISTLFTVCAELVVGFPGFSVMLSLQALIQITLNCLFLRIADYRHSGSNTERQYDRCNYSVCLRVRRNVCRRKYDFGKSLSDYCKFRLDWLPKL